MVDANVDAGAELVALARANDASSLAVVGTSKNAGKTTAVAAVIDALARRGETFAVCSIGRDGEATDALGSHRKPEIALPAGAFAATARALLPRTPALEIVEIEDEISALGEIVLVRARRALSLELAGPPSARALRRIVERLGALARYAMPSALVVVDGAVDRLAALRDGNDAIVVASGASGAATLPAAIERTRALVARLSLRSVNLSRPFVRVEGALTAARVAELSRNARSENDARSAGERDVQIVVRDATHLAIPASNFAALAQRFDVRCDVPLRVVACTVASQSAERAFDPRELRRGVARATGLPTFDVVAGAYAFASEQTGA